MSNYAMVECPTCGERYALPLLTAAGVGNVIRHCSNTHPWPDDVVAREASPARDPLPLSHLRWYAAVGKQA